jgi:predicted nucleotide-binding protein
VVAQLRRRGSRLSAARPMGPRPKVFIGSSVEGLPLANAVFAELDRVAEPTVWDQIFEPMRSTLEDLERKIPLLT